MGIPKFFRYIAQRWPLISQQVNGSIIPEYDNLYLDMNSIVHMCTHANADNVGHLDDNQVFRAISNYIEHLFTVIGPKEVLFMAIDGVAPRAKMNQQRSRRFKSALEAEEQRRKAAEEGVPLDEDPFDSSSITPGTEFMAKLTVHLKYFIARKITEDSKWQSCRIILSGHEVPGEGEHKIMRFIRNSKSQPGYNPNTRHCLYGLDADLIMLGLSTHEPHFSLLREEVTFGRKIQFQSVELSEQKFVLLHISLVREYLQIELLDDEFKDNLDFERMLDDVILIMFFIGNDFLPELPMLLVNDGAIPVIFNTYKQYLAASNNKYLALNGTIDFKALKEWMSVMKQYQINKFEEQTKIDGWFNTQLDAVATTDDEVVLSLEQHNVFDFIKKWMGKVLRKEDESATLEIAEQPKFVQLLADQTGFKYENNVLQLDKAKGVEIKEALRILRIYSSARVHDPNQAEKYGQKLLEWKNRYYVSKFGDSYDSEVVNHAAKKCLEGLQWVLKYYYDDCPSWSWYYDNHYAPMITEIISAIDDDFDIKFEVGEPFRPFEQLMSVLSHRSAALLPPALRRLVLEPTSPIIDFYPHEFKLDRNGKKAEWESVVLIPFIDEQRLLHSVKPIEENELTDVEKFRNSFGVELEFSYNPNENYLYKSPLSAMPDIDACTCSSEKLQFVKRPFVYGRLPDSYSGKNSLAGFASLSTLSYDWQLESGTGVKIFEMPSRDESVIIKIKPASQRIKVGQRVFVNWPYLHEAKVTSVKLPDSSPLWQKVLPKIEGEQRRIGVDVGKVQALIGYRELQGLKRQPNGSFTKEFSGSEVFIPAQLVVTKIAHEDVRFKERNAIPVEEEFPLDSNVLLLLAKFYGFPAKIISHQDSNIDLEATVARYRDPVFAFSKTIAQQELVNTRWWSLDNVAKTLDMNVKFLLALTARLIVNVDGKDVNVALQLRRHGLGLIAQGYSRMTYRKEWEFSDRGVALLVSYLKVFGDKLNKAWGSKQPKLDVETHIKIKEWISKYTKDIKFMPSTSNHLSEGSTKLMEQQLRNVAPIHLEKVLVKQVEKGALLPSDDAHHSLRSQNFRLGDRVVSALDHGKVPLYSRGVVVGINGDSNSQNTSLDIIWDHEFSAGSTLDGRLETRRGLTVSAQSVLNLSNVQLEYVHHRNPVITRISARVDTSDTPATRKNPSVDAKSRLVPASPRNDWRSPGSQDGIASKTSELAKSEPAAVKSNTRGSAPASVGSDHIPVADLKSLQVSSDRKKVNEGDSSESGSNKTEKLSSNLSKGSNKAAKSGSLKSDSPPVKKNSRKDAKRTNKKEPAAQAATSNEKPSNSLKPKVSETEPSKDTLSQDIKLPNGENRKRDPEAAKKILNALFANN